ncbi:phage antirepressor KilAC domain-containing protein [Acetobacter indonesiensis]|uniref:phage antirepressor KilAC domain-containing protein n=1 Tax=Acetobacter indonesiensis TaxID=104101 RepID=UPI0039E8E3AF
MTQIIITPSMHEGELRILDIELGKRLGFSKPVKIRELIKRHLPSLEQIGTVPTVGTVKRGQEATEYYLNRKQAIFITAKSETAEATDITIEIIERFDAYERGEVPTPALPKTYAEALLEAGRMAQQLEVAEERAKLQQAELDATKPKAQALDRISTSDGSYGLQEAAKILQVGPRAFVQWLRTNRWIYKRPGSTNYLGYQDRINAGYLWHKVSTYETTNGETRSRDDVKILPKGLTRLAREVPGASLDPDLSPVPVPGDKPIPFAQAPA